MTRIHEDGEDDYEEANESSTSDSDSDAEDMVEDSDAEVDDTKYVAEEEGDEDGVDEEEVDDDESQDEDDANEEKPHSIHVVGGSSKYTVTGGAEGEDTEDEDDDDQAYLQKFNTDIQRQYLMEFHPESIVHNYEEIKALTTVVRDANNNIIDKFHRTLPYLTKYERARVLGQRAKQINSGAKAFVKVPENVIDGYLIAEMELVQKRIPFIIRRPIPGGACEYWKLKDLEIIGF